MSKDLHGRGIQRLLGENRRDRSLADCVSFEFMESEGLREALALDQHFSEAGFRLPPSEVNRFWVVDAPTDDRGLSIQNPGHSLALGAFAVPE